MKISLLDLFDEPEFSGYLSRKTKRKEKGRILHTIPKSSPMKTTSDDDNDDNQASSPSPSPPPPASPSSSSSSAKTNKRRKPLRNKSKNLQFSTVTVRTQKEKKVQKQKDLQVWEDESDCWEDNIRRACEQRYSALRKRHRQYQPLYPSDTYEASLVPCYFDGLKIWQGGASVSSASRFGNRKFRPYMRGATKAKHERFLEKIASTALLQELAAKTMLPFEVLVDIRLKFLQRAVSSNLKPDMFCEFLFDHYPELRGKHSLTLRLFAFFDRNNNGEISFKEFVVGLGKTVTCSIDEKIEMLFYCLDLTGDENVSVSEILHFIEQGHDDLQSHVEFSQAFVDIIDKDQSGQISLEEFSLAMKENQLIMFSLSKLLPFPSMNNDFMFDNTLNSSKSSPSDSSSSSSSSLSSSANEKNTSTSSNNNNNNNNNPKTSGSGNIFSTCTADTTWDFHHLKQIWYDFYSSEGGVLDVKAKQLDKKQFRTLMSTYFGFRKEAQFHHVDNLFNTFDTDKSGGVSFAEVLRGFSVMLAPSDEELLQFYFTVFDTDGDGVLGIHELQLMLNATTDVSPAMQDKAIKTLLKNYDINGSDDISIDEFKLMVAEHPEMVSMFHQTS